MNEKDFHDAILSFVRSAGASRLLGRGLVMRTLSDGLCAVLSVEYFEWRKGPHFLGNSWGEVYVQLAAQGWIDRARVETENYRKCGGSR